MMLMLMLWSRWLGAVAVTVPVLLALSACAPPPQTTVQSRGTPSVRVTGSARQFPASHGVASSTSGLSDLQRTFEHAVVALPISNGQATLVHMSDVRRNPPPFTHPLATVVYMHGCTGMGDTGILQAMAEAGFAVIAPDSMARRYRPLQCEVATGRGGINLFVYAMRQAELSYALNQMKAMPWIDHNNLFLVGGSEGGVTAALYRGDEFRARVIAAWTCHGAPIVAGIEAPLDEPIFAVVSADDPWYHNAYVHGQGGDCGAYMGGRPGSQSLILPTGSGHDVFDATDGRRAILNFLISNYKR